MQLHVERILSILFLTSLLTWGVYVVLVFIGVDQHLIILTQKETWEAIRSTTLSPAARGLQALVPAAKYLGTQLAPFRIYALTCLLLYLAYAGYSVFRTGKLYLSLRLSAVHVFLLSLFSLWLINISLFSTVLPNQNPRILVEPTKEIYGNIGAEGQEVLKENFEELRAEGCLSLQEGAAIKGSQVYFYRGWCLQKYFMTRVLPPLMMLLLLVLNFLTIGRLFLYLLHLSNTKPLTEFMMSLGLGATGLTVLLWLLALLHLLKAQVAWVFLILIPLAGYRHTLYWLRSSYEKKWRVQCPFSGTGVLLFFLLVSYIVFNYLTVIRPFPIGWDDLGRYINAPRQLSAFSHIIPVIPAIQWEYVTSLGFVLFGYFSTFGATLAMQINWFAGLMALLAVYAVAKYFLGPRTGLLASLFYYTLPMVGHFSYADMKTENAILAYGALGFLAICLSCFGEREEEGEGKEESGQRQQLFWVFVAGILFAAALATKVTAAPMLFMGGILLTSAHLGPVAGVGAFLLSLSLMSYLGGFPIDGVLQRALTGEHPWVENALSLSLLLIGVGLLLYSKKEGKRVLLNTFALRGYMFSVGMLLLGFFTISTPWMLRNLVLHGGELTVEAALKQPGNITPAIVFTPEHIPENAPEGSRALPRELSVNLEHPACKDTARTEELDRYWGYGEGFMHYLSLPWRSVMNIDSQGYYLITSPLLLLLPLLLLSPLFWQSILLRLLFLATSFHVLQWVGGGNGIPWYGIGMFLGLAVLTEAMVRVSPDRVSRLLVSILICIAVGTAFTLRLWQYDMQRNLYEYGWGKSSASVLRELTIPDYDDITEHVLRLSQNPDRPYLYRMGTFISYFIPRNLKIITLNDNQLGFFNCLNQEEDHQLTLKRLQALGFHSIVFDTNTATIEKDSQGTLHQKVQRFVDFLNDPSVGVTPVVNNSEGWIVYVILP